VRRSSLPLLVLALATAGCSSSSSSSPPQITIAPAKTFRIVGFQPTKVAAAGKPTDVTFAIGQPEGGALTRYRHGAGPHTGVHLIIVRKDLSVIVHKHPPIAKDGKISESVTFPAPGAYRVLVDVYPNLPAGQQRNFQLFDNLVVGGAYKPKPLPPFHPTVKVDGYTVTIHGHPKLKAVEPAFLTVTVTGPDGKPPALTPWFGALAHAIFFRAGSLDYFHTHVCGPRTPGCTSTLAGPRIVGKSETPGKLSVGVLLPISGTWRLFLQLQPAGHQPITAPYTLKVR
jgi:hypothetical protein